MTWYRVWCGYAMNISSFFVWDQKFSQILTPFLGHLLLQGGATAVAQLVKALRYNSEGRGFDFPMMVLKFFIVIILPTALWPWARISLWQTPVPIVLEPGRLSLLEPSRSVQAFTGLALPYLLRGNLWLSSATECNNLQHLKLLIAYRHRKQFRNISTVHACVRWCFYVPYGLTVILMT